MAAPLRSSADGIETVGKRSLVFRVLHLAGSTLHVFIGWNACGKNNRRILVVLISFLSKCVSSHRYSFVVQSRVLQILAITSRLLSRHRFISAAPMNTLTGWAQMFGIELQTK